MAGRQPFGQIYTEWNAKWTSQILINLYKMVAEWRGAGSQIPIMMKIKWQMNWINDAPAHAHTYAT